MTLPALPAENEDPWYEKRNAFDLAVKSDLEGRLSDAELHVVRTTQTYTTASLAAAARETGTVVLAASYTVMAVQVSTAARVRLYATVADRTADLTRPRGEDPDPEVDHGVMFDLALGAAGTRISTPPAVCVLNETPPNVPLTIDNLDTVPRAVTVTITYLRTE